jgi:hypothetical protein
MRLFGLGSRRCGYGLIEKDVSTLVAGARKDDHGLYVPNQVARPKS